MQKKVLKWSSWEMTGVGHFPAGEVLLVASQYEDDTFPTLWIEHPDNYHQLDIDTYYIKGTGHDIEANLKHVGSCIMLGGQLVWHVYRKMNERDLASTFA